MRKKYLDILGLSSEATEEDIKKAYRTLAKQNHPDINKASNAEEKFREIKTAYDYLISNKKTNEAEFNFENDGYFGGNDFRFNHDMFGGTFERGYFGNNRRSGPVQEKKTYASYLDIVLEETILLEDLFKKDIFTFKYKKFIQQNNRQEFFNQTIDVFTYLIIEHITTQGNDSVSTFNIETETNTEITESNFGSFKIKTTIYGRIKLKITIEKPINIRINGLNIHQETEISLASLLLDENFQVETFLQTKYKIKINSLDYLDRINVRIPKIGIKLNQYQGDYIFEFRIISPKLGKLTSPQLKKFKDLLVKI